MFSSQLDTFQNNSVVQKAFRKWLQMQEGDAYRDGLFVFVAKQNKHIRVVVKVTLKNITTSVGFNTFGNEQFKY